MDAKSGILIYPLCTMYKMRAHTSNPTQTRKNGAVSAHARSPYFEPVTVAASTPDRYFFGEPFAGEPAMRRKV